MTRVAPAVVISIVVLLACAEQPTATDSVASLASSTGAAGLSNDPAHPVAAVPATVTWEATGGALAASRLTSPIAAARGYGLLGIAQYGAVMAARPGDDDA